MWRFAGRKETGAYVSHFIFFKGEATKMFVKKMSAKLIYTSSLLYSGNLKELNIDMNTDSLEKSFQTASSAKLNPDSTREDLR